MPLDRKLGHIALPGCRRGSASRMGSVVLALYLVIPPGAVAAQGAASTAFAEFVPALSFGLTRLDDARLRDLGTSLTPDHAQPRSFSIDDVLDPIPKTSSLTFQPTY